ncbi:TetR/AcrR family transcriptional regulator [Streptomyces sp. NPDC048430]|uniref:TetR/AcrR family transcriptional regulator n=1 Tax=Streptomyces sp. NPDC048430 TaxID=3155388 RepID=UPI003430D75C
MTNEREALLLAAADFLSRRPNATVPEIAKAMGVSRATLHRHFAGGRAELLQALSDLAAEKLQLAIAEARIEEGDCADAVRRLVAHCEEGAPYLTLLYSFSQEEAPDIPHPAWDEADAAIYGLFERGRRSGEFTTDLTAAWLTEAFYSLMAGAVWAVQSGRCAQRDFIPMVAQMVLSGAGHNDTDKQST